jgi:hypothetical protein
MTAHYQTALVCDVDELEPRAVGTDLQVVPEQAATKLFGLYGSRRSRATLHKKHIEVAIIVAVEERNARANNLRVVVLVCSATMVGKGEFRLQGNVFEPGAFVRGSGCM